MVGIFCCCFSSFFLGPSSQFVLFCKWIQTYFQVEIKKSVSSTEIHCNYTTGVNYMLTMRLNKVSIKSWYVCSLFVYETFTDYLNFIYNVFQEMQIVSKRTNKKTKKIVRSQKLHLDDEKYVTFFLTPLFNW